MRQCENPGRHGQAGPYVLGSPMDVDIKFLVRGGRCQLSPQLLMFFWCLGDVHAPSTDGMDEMPESSCCVGMMWMMWMVVVEKVGGGGAAKAYWG